MLSAILLVSITSLPFLSSSYDHFSTFCSPDKGNYNLGDGFETNLKRLLNDLSSNTMRNGSFPGFYNSAIEDVRDEVYGQALCRGDVIDSATCQSCVKNASHNILTNCNRKDAVIWYDLCQVRYSFQKFFTLMTYTGKYPESDDLKEKISDNQVREFGAVLDKLIVDITNDAAFVPSKRMFATGQARFSRNETIYGLVQCTRDIAQGDCSNCLNSALGDLNNCCSFRQGGFVVSRTCNVRFELYRFYNDTSSLYPVPKEDKWKTKKIAVAIFASVILVAISLCSCAVFNLRKKGKVRDDDDDIIEQTLLRELESRTTITVTDEGQLLTSKELPFVDLITIRAATNDFALWNKLGQGGFGTVYKGVLPDGKEVAVKRLSRQSWQGLEEFKNEVILISKLQHRNLSRLVGCSFEGEEKLLLYEFMPNRSLDFYIFDKERRSQLNWDTYYNIISGIARGLLYLHEDSPLKIIHRDLKPSNVLLDIEMVAKISDFGMARIFCENQNTANYTKRVVGTFGYMAPEYAMGGIFSVKSDVFSFGVILLEIISGNKNSGFQLKEHGQSLLSYAWSLWKEERELEFVDPMLIETNCPNEEVRRLIHIGLLCVQEDPKDRPTMTDVVVLLPRSESIISHLPQPKEPAFSIGRDFIATHLSISDSINPTVNGITMSDILPR